MTVGVEGQGNTSTVCVAVVDEDTCQAQENIQGGTWQGKHLRSWGGGGGGRERMCANLRDEAS